MFDMAYKYVKLDEHKQFAQQVAYTTAILPTT